MNRRPLQLTSSCGSQLAASPRPRRSWTTRWGGLQTTCPTRPPTCCALPCATSACGSTRTARAMRSCPLQPHVLAFVDLRRLESVSPASRLARVSGAVRSLPQLLHLV
ncbi:hypothetical protein BU14_1469s0001 [Porphyra umbilicalis]|uniref:Uncharacterized protein n=1 Tax=Porphyra umbilicalis TaxID=2786 RepID=A0A1X6NLF7_PORUM|nr:hypothetical protein BU14_1469s0001 [Porphyra umbilicalis]|eukprot:OSX69479.1 hypothetical protein BU14_1469s0001 [Porphyra umbilicalis]